MNVEGYPGMTDDAFKRRFSEDRAELREIGIRVESETGDDGVDLYSLPGDAYYLPKVEFSADEITALAACFAVLQDGFAYSQPLRLALLSLTQGRPELLTRPPTPALAVVPEAAEQPTLLPKLQAAVDDRKTVRFTYYTIQRDEESERTVDPYGLQLVAGEWYLIGRCHLRDAVRTFRLSRIHSRVVHATKKLHDFTRPADFDLEAYQERPAWRLGPVAGTARVHVSASMAWWVEAHWSHCGCVEEQDDGSIVFSTEYADTRRLLSWVLSMAEAAELLGPPELRDALRERLAALQALLAAPPPALEDAPLAPAGRGRRPRRRRPAPRRLARGGGPLHAPQHPRLVPPHELRQGRGRPEGRGRVRRPRRLAQGTCGRTSACSTRWGTSAAWCCTRSSPRPAGCTCCATWRGPRSRAPPGSHPCRPTPCCSPSTWWAGSCRRRAARPWTAPGRRSGARATAGPRSAPTTCSPGAAGVLDAVNAAIAGRRLLRIEYWKEGTAGLSERVVEPYLVVHERGEWYYICWCRMAEGRRMFRVATTRSATVLDETFMPRDDLELDLYRREGVPPSASYAPKTATVWYSHEVSRWVEERQPVRRLADGSCVAEQPFVEEGWLTQHVLPFADKARVLGPPVGGEPPAGHGGRAARRRTAAEAAGLPWAGSSGRRARPAGTSSPGAPSCSSACTWATWARRRQEATC